MDTGVYKAIAKVTGMMAGEGISKGRKNQQQGYAFRGIDDVYNTLSRMLADAGLCIIPRVLSRQMVEKHTKAGSPLFYVTVEAEYDLVSAEDGSKHTARSIGEAMDSADKATNKAMSAAYKYMAFQTFAIPTEGDNDADAHTPEAHSKAPTPPPQKVREQAAAMRAAPTKTITGDPAEGDLSGLIVDKPDTILLRKITDAFMAIGFDIPALEKEYGKGLDDWNMADVADAREVLKVKKAEIAAQQTGGVI